MPSPKKASPDTPVADKVSHAAHRVAEDVKASASHHGETAKDEAADHVSAVADAAAAARDELPAGTVADPLMGQAVDALGKVADHLRHSDLDTLVREAGEFIRRNPVLVLGGAALVGFAAARFLKSGSASRSTAASDDPWSNHLERS